MWDWSANRTSTPFYFSHFLGQNLHPDSFWPFFQQNSASALLSLVVAPDKIKDISNYTWTLVTSITGVERWREDTRKGQAVHARCLAN